MYLIADILVMVIFFMEYFTIKNNAQVANHENKNKIIVSLT